MTRFANLREFTVDRDLSAGGARLELGGGRWISVRQAGGFNRRFEHAHAMALRERGIFDLEDELERRLASDEVSVEVAAQCLVVSFGGFLDENGAEIEPTPEAVRELLTDHPAIFDLVMTFAYREGNFRRQADTKSD